MQEAALETGIETSQTRRCPACGWTDVRRSMAKGFLDGLVRLVGLLPYRCRSCGQRFYRRTC